MSDLAAISTQLSEIQRSLGRVESAVSDLPDLRKRVGKLENWRNYILGVVAAGAAILGYQIKTHT